MITRRSFFKGLGAGIACLGLGVKFGVADPPAGLTVAKLLKAKRGMEAQDARRRVLIGGNQCGKSFAHSRLVEEYVNGVIDSKHIYFANGRKTI